MLRRKIFAALSTTALAACGPFVAVAAEETQDRELSDLNNTVVNLLESLVQKGIMTNEQARELVADARRKSAEQAQANATQGAVEPDAVRVTYVPEIVKQQLREDVRAELREEVTKDVVAQAKAEKWGVPGALPDWVSAFKFYGDVRVRGQGDFFAPDNAQGFYIDALAINDAGGIGPAGAGAFINTTEDRVRARVRLRFGVTAQLSDSFTAGLRIGTGNLRDPVSSNQTLGQSNQRYTLGVDQAYLRFDANPKAEIPWMTFWGGRIENPWVSTDLVFDSDLNFEGLASTWRMGFDTRASTRPFAFLTVGAFPLQEVELSSDDKWLYGGQLGINWSFTSGLRAKLAGAYYYYDNIKGQLNAPDSDLFDFTAPRSLQRGNVLFDINSDGDPSTNLLALAADYHLLDVVGELEYKFAGYRVSLLADYVTNEGYDAAEVLLRTGQVVAPRTDGYQLELGFGTATTGQRGNWRAGFGYRYLQRDAVLDAFTDSDFHGGGTDAKGYFLRGEWWFLRNTSLALRYLSSSEIDGPPLGIDTLQLDLNGYF